MPKQTVKEKTENKKGVPTNENETRARARVSDVDVWCRYDEAVDITELVENPRNPNKHPDKQIALLAKIIRHQGWRQPITVSKRSGFIVKGHGRLQAAKVLNVEQVPVEYQDYLTEAAEYADLIADNRIAELAEPDALMIDELLKDVMFEDFDLELTGFTDEDLLLNDSDEMMEETKNSDYLDDDAVEGFFKIANRMVIEEIVSYCDGKSNLLHPDINKGSASVEFINAKYRGGNYRRKNSFAFGDYQFKTAGSKYSIYEGLKRSLSGEMKIERFRFLCNENITLHNIIDRSLPVSGSRLPADFPAALARNLIDKYCKEEGSILDPCHGWGGRLVGFLMSRNAIRYTGVDPSPDAGKMQDEIAETFKQFVCETKETNRVELPFESFDSNDKFDFAITSPPYFDVEKYNGDASSRNVYSNYDLWKDGFFKQLIEKTHSLLNNNCVFCLQVGSQQYPLLEDGKVISEACGFTVEEVFSSGMNRFGDHETEFEKSEVIMILRKKHG
ncbi:MAG: ParB N-terminal domain-containing protein [Desulfobacterales bacterium]|nr:ParB N-terminal domain-containing protein [Desulfobacterales bacterium]